MWQVDINFVEEALASIFRYEEKVQAKCQIPGVHSRNIHCHSNLISHVFS